MKLKIFLKISEILIQIVPLLIYAYLNLDKIIQPTVLYTTTALLIALFLMLIFKDSFRHLFKEPSVWIISLILLIFASTALMIGNLLFEVSLIVFISVTASLPLGAIHNILYNKTSKEKFIEEFVNKMKGANNG